MDINKIIRKLAKSLYYQTIYGNEKNANLRIFDNDSDFTMLQIRFLNDLSFYNMLYMDLNLGEVDDRIFQDEIYEDAYMFYKSKKDNPRARMDNRPSPVLPVKDKGKTTQNISSWVFKTKKKGD
jgi:hypothetical protein